MKMNFNIIKVVGAVAIVLAAIWLTFNFVQPQTYSGTTLDFSISDGLVSVNNPSTETIPAQITGTSSRAFRISDASGVLGTSTVQTNEGASTQLFELALPPGTTEFTITRGSNVHFVATSTTNLTATVSPITPDTQRTALIAAAVVILIALFYASHVMEHQWINVLLRREKQIAAAPAAPVEAQGNTQRSFGDNRAKRD